MVYLLLILGIAGIIIGMMMPGLDALLLVAVPSAIAALLLCVQSLMRSRRVAGRRILIDGSNVMHWKDNTPRIETLREVIAHLSGLGLTPAVIFDANAGYLLAGRYQDDRSMARALGLPEKHVLVVPKGTIADSYLLSVAREYGAPIVTNDRYRDWAGEFPEIAEAGHLVRGGYRNGALWLDQIPQGA